MSVKKEMLYIVECPWCNKQLSVNKETKTISPAVKAEKEETMYTEKVTQTTLDQPINTGSEEETDQS